MAQVKDAVSVANKVFRTYENRRPERIAKEMGILIIPAPFKKQKGAYKVIERQPIIFINDSLHPVVREIVFGHELGHHLLHREEAIQAGGFQEFNLFDMRENRMEYEANLFAADLLLEDDDVAEMSKNEDLNYFGFCSSLNASPELMSFKLYSLMKRGQAYHMPMEIQSNFLAK